MAYTIFFRSDTTGIQAVIRSITVKQVAGIAIGFKRQVLVKRSQVGEYTVVAGIAESPDRHLQLVDFSLAIAAGIVGHFVNLVASVATNSITQIVLAGPGADRNFPGIRAMAGVPVNGQRFPELAVMAAGAMAATATDIGSIITLRLLAELGRVEDILGRLRGHVLAALTVAVFAGNPEFDLTGVESCFERCPFKSPGSTYSVSTPPGCRMATGTGISFGLGEDLFALFNNIN